MSLSPALLELMSKVIDGQASSRELMESLQRESGTAKDEEIGHVEGAAVDLGRKSRCGFGEVIYGEGKSAELITRIIQTQLLADQSALVTRIDPEVAFRVRQSFPQADHNPLARTLQARPSDSDSEPGADVRFHVAVVSAGSTDAPVAEEALETLNWMNVAVRKYDDIGVAGPQRLRAVVPTLREASAVVVVAGMEGALPAVVAGHLAVPIFAVPTSVGYGASFGGLTPLMGMLSSCASNVAVVNIDAGFKGGYLAGIVARQLQNAAT
ncbi:MAG: nickel pincer cofactor biosynthesis protein LarB [Rubripirellula sp.]